MFNKNVAFQLSIALLILFICYALQVRCVPYMSMSERTEVLNSHRQRALAGDARQVMLASVIAAVKRAGRREGGVASMDRLRAKKESNTVSFFWNYNTVESVLLFCAVLINLAGPCSVHRLVLEFQRLM